MAKLTEAQFKALKKLELYEKAPRGVFHQKVTIKSLVKRGLVAESYIDYALIEITDAGRAALAAERERLAAPASADAGAEANTVTVKAAYEGRLWEKERFEFNGKNVWSIKREITRDFETAWIVMLSDGSEWRVAEDKKMLMVDPKNDMAAWREYVNRETPVTVIGCACCQINAAVEGSAYCASCEDARTDSAAMKLPPFNPTSELKFIDTRTDAEKIATLQADNARLAAERDAALAEVERLREALRQIHNNAPKSEPNERDLPAKLYAHSWAFWFAADVAHKALTGE